MNEIVSRLIAQNSAADHHCISFAVCQTDTVMNLQ